MVLVVPLLAAACVGPAAHLHGKVALGQNAIDNLPSADIGVAGARRSVFLRAVSRNGGVIGIGDGLGHGARCKKGEMEKLHLCGLGRGRSGCVEV